MIRRSLLTAALIIVGSAALAPKTLAQTADVPFTGNVSGVCNFDQITPGKLGLNQVTNPTALAGGFPGGAFGKVFVSCNQGARVSISKPQQTGGPSFTPSYSVGIINSPFGSTDSQSSNSVLLPSGSGLPLDIDMIVDKGSTLVPGNYSYVTTLTIVP
ncbi:MULTISPECIES: hypothetical protein [Nostoc]|uniref:Spore coat protein U domain-containing protein n=1 Tax=Nostoc paludosum FACHB-159 TaxID=2692908 RepID=A0ABR8K430_9NOSO|nr:MULTISPECIES: hypothetical protein [Nostoc]MBD2676867.1 hypothetical protein [Nostoc sp. FACHB-857]MBD2733065.1 hypothetical protein [Nostoc paludosum FACHB-159]